MTKQPIPQPDMQPQQATVKLGTPIVRGEQTITEITLRKPKSGELRGLSLSELMKADVGTLQTLLPRITQPTLTTQDVDGMDVVDLVIVAGEVLGFFMAPEDRAKLSPSPAA